MKSWGVRFLCGISGLMRVLCWVGDKKEWGGGVKGVGVKKEEGMKGKRIYKMVWGVLVVWVGWGFRRVGGGGRGIRGYMVFCGGGLVVGVWV